MNNNECPKCGWCNHQDAATCSQCGSSFRAPADADREKLAAGLWTADALRREAKINALCGSEEWTALLNKAASQLEIYAEAVEMVRKIVKSTKHKDPLSDILCECNRAERLAVATVLTPEDEAALARSKPALMRKIARILKSPNS